MTISNIRGIKHFGMCCYWKITNLEVVTVTPSSDYFSVSAHRVMFFVDMLCLTKLIHMY